MAEAKTLTPADGDKVGQAFQDRLSRSELSLDPDFSSDEFDW